MTDSMRKVSRTPSGGVSLRPRGSLAAGRASLFDLAIASGTLLKFWALIADRSPCAKAACKTPRQGYFAAGALAPTSDAGADPRADPRAASSADPGVDPGSAAHGKAAARLRWARRTNGSWRSWGLARR